VEADEPFWGLDRLSCSVIRKAHAGSALSTMHPFALLDTGPTVARPHRGHGAVHRRVCAESRSELGTEICPRRFPYQRTECNLESPMLRPESATQRAVAAVHRGFVR